MQMPYDMTPQGGGGGGGWGGNDPVGNALLTLVASL